MNSVVLWISSMLSQNDVLTPAIPLRTRIVTYASNESYMTARARTFPRSDARCDLVVGKVLVRHTEVVLEAVLVIISELAFDLVHGTTRIINDRTFVRYGIAPFATTRTL